MATSLPLSGLTQIPPNATKIIDIRLFNLENKEEE